jgi:hypothetical protein
MLINTFQVLLAIALSGSLDRFRIASKQEDTQELRLIIERFQVQIPG